MLEEFVSACAGNALDSLAKLLPDQVTVRREGEDLVVSLEDVQSGNLVLIRSGDRIPIHGTISQGTAAVNQAAITGESLPIEKQVGDLVYAGTLNELGVLEVRTTKVGEETALGQIHRMVEEAQAQKAPIERILNRYAKFYTPAALILGASDGLTSNLSLVMEVARAPLTGHAVLITGLLAGAFSMSIGEWVPVHLSGKRVDDRSSSACWQQASPLAWENSSVQQSGSHRCRTSRCHPGRFALTSGPSAAPTPMVCGEPA